MTGQFLKLCIDGFDLDEEAYQFLSADASEILRSVRFPGLWLETDCLLSSDLVEVLRVLQQGIGSSAHQELVKSLFN